MRQFGRRSFRQPSRLHAALLRSRPLQGPSAHGGAATRTSNASSTTCSAFDGVTSSRPSLPSGLDFLVQYGMPSKPRPRLDAPISTAPVPSRRTSGPEGRSFMSNASKADSSASSATSKPCNSFLFWCLLRSGLDSSPSHGCNVFFTGTFSTENSASIHVRLQTWAPFTLQVYVNGHDWLAQQLALVSKIGFVLKHNAFTQLRRAGQGPASGRSFRQARLGQDPRLGSASASIRCCDPAESLYATVCGASKVVDQAEFATDLVFKSPRRARRPLSEAGWSSRA